MNASDKRAILKKLADCSEKDFDGHTDFTKLSPKDRLLWLSNTAYFVYTAALKNPHLNCNKYFSQ